MAYRPDDEHDKLLSLQKQINTLRTSGAIFRNNGVGINTAQAGVNSSVASTSIIGSWAFPPVNHNVGSATGTGGAFVNNVADGSGRYHIQIKSTTINVVGTPNPLVLSYIDGTQRNGQFVLIRCAQGQSLTLKAATATNNTQGNINMSSDLSLSSTQMAILQFWNDVGTAGGQYILISTTGTGGSSSGANVFLSNLSSPTAINQDLVFGDGKSANSKNIDNVNNIYFKDSVNDGGSPPHITTNSYFTPSGDGKELDLILAGYDAVAFSTDGTTTGVFQMYGKNGVGTIKPTSLKVNPTGTTVGEIRFDGFDSSPVEVTYAGVDGFCVSNTHGTSQGRLRFNILNGSFGFIEAGHVDGGGWNFDGNFLVNFSYPVKYIGSNNTYSVQSTDKIISYIGTTGTANVTLPLSTSFAGVELYLIHNGTGGTVNFNTQAGDFINGFTTLTANTRYEKAIIVSDGTRWIQIV